MSDKTDSTNEKSGANFAPDFSFVRDGVSLTECLWQLVSEDRTDRTTAGERLQSMWQGLPTLHTDYATLDRAAYTAGGGGEGQMKRFAIAVREAVAATDTGDFVRRLVAFHIALKRDWYARVEVSMGRGNAQDQKFDRLTEPLVEQINTASDEAAKQKAIHRFARITRAYLCAPLRGIGTDEDPYHNAESTAPSGTMTFHLLRLLGPLAMAAPEAIEAMLNEYGLANEGIDLITAAGPAAISFVPRLIERLDALPGRRAAGEQSVYFDAARAIGAAGRGDMATVELLLVRLAHSDTAVRDGAAMSLREMNGDVAGRNAAVVKALLTHFDPEEGPDVQTLASVGRDDPAVRAIVLDRIKQRPPRMVSSPDFPQYTYDAAMSARGPAIDATAYLTAYPTEFVPALVDAINTFKEYDSDWNYSGPHARVAAALERFGPAAAPAAGPLAEQLGVDPDDEYPKAIISALRAIGPAAIEAVPLMTVFYAKQTGEPLPDLNAGPIDPADDPLASAIQFISGRP